MQWSQGGQSEKHLRWQCSFQCSDMVEHAWCLCALCEATIRPDVAHRGLAVCVVSKRFDCAEGGSQSLKKKLGGSPCSTPRS